METINLHYGLSCRNVTQTQFKQVYIQQTMVSMDNFILCVVWMSIAILSHWTQVIGQLERYGLR